MSTPQPVQKERNILTQYANALEAGTDFLAQFPDIRLQFTTHSDGSLADYPTGSAADLLKVMDDACGGFSNARIAPKEPHIVDATLHSINIVAIEWGRSVSTYKKDGRYITEISPVTFARCP